MYSRGFVFQFFMSTRNIVHNHKKQTLVLSLGLQYSNMCSSIFQNHKTHMWCWGKGSLKSGKINSENSYSRCSYDVIPGRSHGGLSPIRLYQAAPQPTPAPLKQHDVNHHWTVDSICGQSSAPSGNMWGWRTQMEVHLKANRNIFDVHRISFPLSLNHVSSTNTFIFHWLPLKSNQLCFTHKP